MRRGILAVLLSCTLAIVALEALLHLVPVPDPYAQLRRPDTHRFHLYLPSWNVWTTWFGQEPPFVRVFATGPLIGVSTRNVTITVNRLGYLYDEAKARRQSGDELRIGVVGGSTVECASLEVGRRWPDVLERLVSQRDPGRRVTVLNLGVSGTDSRTYLATVAQHAVKLDLDYLVFMLGGNDMFRVNSTEHPLDGLDAFMVQEQRRGLKSFLFRFQLPRRLRVLFNRIRGTEYYVAAAGTDAPYFAARLGEVQSLSELPSAAVEITRESLIDYERNVVSLAALAAAHSVTPVFTTQPMLWKPEMSAREKSVDWLIGTVMKEGRRQRVSSSQQAHALETLNRRLLETCARRGLKCIDLEKEIPRSLDYFYDSVHFNEAGAQKVAEHVAGYLAELALAR
jgi:lysophospholipase L1-like esterase